MSLGLLRLKVNLAVSLPRSRTVLMLVPRDCLCVYYTAAWLSSRDGSQPMLYSVLDDETSVSPSVRLLIDRCLRVGQNEFDLRPRPTTVVPYSHVIGKLLFVLLIHMGETTVILVIGTWAFGER